MANDAVNPAPAISASVGPGDGNPKGYMWDALDACGTDVECMKNLRAFARKHGYSEDGQLVKAIDAKIAAGE